MVGRVQRPRDFHKPAARRGQQGVVVVLIYVSAEGTTASADIARSSGFPLLDRAAIDAVIAKHDPEGFHHLLQRLPQQARDGWDTGQSWPIPDGFRTPSRVVLLACALGGVARHQRLHLD